MFGFRTDLGHRETLYRMLAQALESGIPIAQAVELTLGKASVPGASDVVRRIRAGSPLSEALQGHPRFPAEERIGLEAAERSGTT